VFTTTADADAPPVNGVTKKASTKKTSTKPFSRLFGARKKNASTTADDADAPGPMINVTTYHSAQPVKNRLKTKMSIYFEHKTKERKESELKKNIFSNQCLQY
jgi:hypothetical protein